MRPVLVEGFEQATAGSHSPDPTSWGDRGRRGPASGIERPVIARLIWASFRRHGMPGSQPTLRLHVRLSPACPEIKTE
jgi:hypothetical protein